MAKQTKDGAQTGLPQLARRINLQTVTRRMRRMELFSKIDLARELGISTTTMTKLFAQLEGGGLIARSPVTDTSFGRPKILYQLSPVLQVAAIVIDVETTTICFSDLQGGVRPEHCMGIPTGKNPGKLFARIEREFTGLRKKLSAPCRLVGVCIPGLIEKQTGQSMLNPNLHWMEDLRPAETLSEKLGLPAVVMHEEKALSRAQLRTTDASSNYITMDFSSGVGMSVVMNGEHLTGASGFAGEIGHIIMQPGGKPCGCGNRGCLETIASDRVFPAELGTSMNTALLQLRQGIPHAIDTAKRVLEAQATGIAAVINIFNPDRVFVYSHLAEAYPGYVEALRNEVGKRAIGLSFGNCQIRTTHEDKLKGALLETIDHLLENTTSGNG